MTLRSDTNYRGICRGNPRRGGMRGVGRKAAKGQQAQKE